MSVLATEPKLKENFWKFQTAAFYWKKTNRILIQTQDTNFGCKFNKSAHATKNWPMSSKYLFLVSSEIPGIVIAYLQHVPHGCLCLSNCVYPQRPCMETFWPKGHSSLLMSLGP